MWHQHQSRASPNRADRTFLHRLQLTEANIRNVLFLAVGALALSAPALAQTPGKPAITPVTMESGGIIAPERAALRMTALDLAIEVKPEDTSLWGVATLTLSTSMAQKILYIDLDKNLPVSAVSIDGKPLKAGGWANPEGRLAITLARPLKAGASVVVKITYGGTPHVAIRAPWDDGMVWSRTRDRKPWIASTQQGYGCDLFWPCLDFPAGEPAKVDMHITVPAGLSAPAGGVLVGIDKLADGRTTWNWRQRSPNPYSVVLNVAPYKELTEVYHSRFGNSFPMYYWYTGGRDALAKGLFEEFAPTVDFFEANVGPFPWYDEKLGVVETPHLGMEHQTINAYGNNYEKDTTGFDWLFQHELSHEWFGNQVTAANWDDMWIHEGYAQYMQPMYGRWREGEARYAIMMHEFRVSIANKAPLISGQIRTEEQVYEEANGGPGSDIYVKGAWMLHTLRNLIGDKAFWEVTTRLVYGRPDPKPGNFQPRFSSSLEYIQIVNQVTGKDYTWFFDVYLREAALPELIEKREGGTLTLTWKAPKGKPFPLPVEVLIGDRVQLVPMTGGTAKLDVPPGTHVVVDPASRILKRSQAIEAYQRRMGRR